MTVTGSSSETLGAVRLRGLAEAIGTDQPSFDCDCIGIRSSLASPDDESRATPAESQRARAGGSHLESSSLQANALQQSLLR